MVEYPDNSHLAKDAAAAKDVEGEKKIEKVVVGKVVRQKMPLAQRLREIFIGGDAQSVGRYILMEILVPAAKDTFSDIVSQGVEKMVYGEARSSSRRTGARPGGSTSGSYVNYSRFGSDRARNQDRHQMTSRDRASFNFDRIILDTRDEAQEVLDQMFAIISKYNSVSVADLYDLVGLESKFTDNKWGWTDIKGAGAVRVTNGYLLDLPRPEVIE
jgi:hypothetical protein